MVRRALTALLSIWVVLALPALAAAAEGEPGSNKHPLPPKPNRHGILVQLSGRSGCVAAAGAKAPTCAKARGLAGPGVGVGSHAIAISPDGRDVYVAASTGNAIVVFARNPRSGVLEQPKGRAGCVAAKAEHGCGEALGLNGPNSVAVSPDGRNVYATSREGDSVTSFHRNRKTGALEQLPPSSSGCISGLSIPGCSAGRALSWPDVVAVSPDGKNVYVGSFAGSAVVSFARDPGNGALAQLGGTAGCIALATSGCATGVGLGNVEGLDVSRDGSAVYAAAASSNAVAVLGRSPETGALAQAADGSGCIVDGEAAGCTPGVQIAGANTVAVGPRGAFYVTSLLSSSVTAFTEIEPAKVVQNASPAGCVVFLRSTACGFGRAMSAPEGVTVSPDGSSIYLTAFGSGAIDVLERDPGSGAIQQKPHRAGCVAPRSVPGCTLGRALSGAGSAVVSPDGRNVYSTAFFSNAVDVFTRIR